MMTEREREGEKEEGDKNKSLLALNLFFVEFSHLNGADITGVQMGRGGGAHMYTVLNHTS